MEIFVMCVDFKFKNTMSLLYCLIKVTINCLLTIHSTLVQF